MCLITCVNGEGPESRLLYVDTYSMHHKKGYTQVLTVTTMVVSNNPVMTLMSSMVNGLEATGQANGLEALLTGVTSAINM